MFSYVSKNRIISIRLRYLLVVIFLFLLNAKPLSAQEEDLFGTTADDSLLFGDEFDLGGDDFSFDLEEDAPAEEGVSEGDDFFGESEDDVESSAEEDSTEVEEDWGFDDLAEDDSTTNELLETEYPDHPLNFRKNFQGTMFDGAGITLSFYSPQYVASKLETWHSVVDFSMSIELPYHFEAAPANISFLVDISSFNFQNSFPAGGTFTGVSIMPAIVAEIAGIEVEAGIGIFTPTFGIMTGLGYAIQHESLFVSAGYRWNWAYKIDPIGSAWWLEPRITVGIKLW